MPVATLTFSKSAYRLGETVLGVLDVNDRGSGGGKVLKVILVVNQKASH